MTTERNETNGDTRGHGPSQDTPAEHQAGVVVKRAGFYYRLTLVTPEEVQPGWEVSLSNPLTRRAVLGLGVTADWEAEYGNTLTVTASGIRRRAGGWEFSDEDRTVYAAQGMSLLVRWELLG